MKFLRYGIKSWRPKKTPLLLKQHRDARLKLIRQYKENLFWWRVLWTKETKLNCYQNHAWRKDSKAYSPKNMVATIKFGSDSIMIWGCFSAKGMGKILVIDGKKNAQKYK